MSKMIKYALYSYSTENVGDDIQSIAARRFLPQIDYYIDRDKVGHWKNDNSNEEVRLIANGWYMRQPFAWPPQDKSLKVLLTSMYIEPRAVGINKGKVPLDIFTTPSSLRFLRENGPIGARDLFTLRKLQENNIESYFSGCLTLTIKRDERIKRRDFILAVDISDELYNFLRKQTNRRIIRLSPYSDFNLLTQDRTILAEFFLYLYQSAYAVVTTRLHTLLPSLAVETPVLLIKGGHYDKNRYSGLSELSINITEKQYKRNYQFYNLDAPPCNPTKYRGIRRELVKKCSNFTGYDSDKSFLSTPLEELLTSESLINIFSDSFSMRLPFMLIKMSLRESKKMLSDLEQENTRLIDNARQQAEEYDQLQEKYDGLVYDYNQIKNTSLNYIIRVIKNRLVRLIK